ncbi:nitroreductase family protein [Nocardioides sp. T2.26MG-1]|uniref:nitroreductase family protein n=1 Tax=Nocardioides sp. T2.26MG-1 TaxID=3041166 RepID=UPI002477714F|nr:nitroreductase family protein [Nocardioides sp. T2.26MG-1]CAI9411677.1 Protein DrgA [Nocardioides sp. T2.26MG-1]
MDPLDPPVLHPLLRERRSVREYDESHRLDDVELAALLEAARWAPSAGNSQPWAFLVGRRDDGAHRVFVPLLAPSVRRWAPAASALVFALHQVASGPEEDALVYSDYAAYDLGQAVAHLTVQAAALGLSTHQFAAFDHAGLAAACGVPPHWAVTTGIAVGRGVTSELAPRVRRPMAEVAYAGRFGAPVLPG